MKKVGAMVGAVIVSMVLLSQTASAGTSVSVGISTPGMYFEASNARPSPHHVWVAGRHEWNGYHRMWVPGHWRYQPVERVVYVPVRHQGYGHHDRWDSRRDGSCRERGDGRYERNGDSSDRYDRTDRSGRGTYPNHD